MTLGISKEQVPKIQGTLPSGKVKKTSGAKPRVMKQNIVSKAVALNGRSVNTTTSDAGLKSKGDRHDVAFLNSAVSRPVYCELLHTSCFHGFVLIDKVTMSTNSLLYDKHLSDLFHLLCQNTHSNAYFFK